MLDDDCGEHATSRLVRLNVTVSYIVEEEAQGFVSREVGSQAFQAAAVLTGSAEVKRLTEESMGKLHSGTTLKDLTFLPIHRDP
ncbi:hypothetical protein J2X72_004531 [Phyllobacterium sp. 1468]|uniref:hypothetical protein n=1 Tax=Phyllobacterium sp. 1468 TaxID=2817759 RepID=UPI002860E152|nr:hypothetical protein [Phyllobacterium sp. 1468]MDR6635717.1 hypothetical protein [Phyllobacterium sp. 1468]